MSDRAASSRGPVLLVLLLLVVAAIALAGLLVPLYECPDCGGAFRRGQEQAAKTPKGIAAAPTNCPRCGDRGAVAFFNKAFRPALPSDVSGLVRHGISLGASSDEFFGHLERVLKQAELGLRLSGPPSGTDWRFWRGDSRFVRDRDKDFVLVLLQQRGWSIPGDSTVWVVLIDLGGRVLDSMGFTCGTREGFLLGQFSTDPGPKGTVVQVVMGIDLPPMRAPVEIGLKDGKLEHLDPAASASLRIR